MIKKLQLYVDNKGKQIFKEGDLSEDEMKKIEHGYKVQERLLDNVPYKDSNPEKKPYILLLKKINNIRTGNVNIFDRVIYFEEKDRELAKRRIVYAFKEIMNGRDKISLQNLGFINESNLKFVNSLLEEKKEIKKEKKEGKK